MNDIETSIFIAMAAVLAAFVTGVISLVNLIVSKDMKVSELRQDWINSLRDEVSSYIASVNGLSCQAVENKDNNGSDSDFATNNISLINEVDTLSHKIRLRLNPIEHEDTITLISDIERFITHDMAVETYIKVHNYQSKLNDNVQKILKSEWNRVKKGENSYRAVKYISIILLLITMVVSIYTYLNLIA